MIGTLIVFTVALFAAFVLGVATSWLFHREAIGQLKQRAADLDQERRHFLDQLARATSGVPMFGSAGTPVPPEPEPEEHALTEQEKEVRWLNEVSHRPGRLAQRVSRMLMRKHRGEQGGFEAAMADLEQAERNGAKG